MELKAVLLLEIVFQTRVCWLLLLLLLFLAWALWDKKICLHFETSHQRTTPLPMSFLYCQSPEPPWKKDQCLLSAHKLCSSQGLPLRGGPPRIWDFLLACGSTWSCWNHLVCGTMLCSDLKGYFYMNFSVENINKLQQGTAQSLFVETKQNSLIMDNRAPCWTQGQNQPGLQLPLSDRTAFSTTWQFKKYFKVLEKYTPSFEFPKAAQSLL